MNRLFEIQTLSDRNYRRLADPITVIAGIATILPTLFPNLTGSERLSMAHLNQLFPGNGFYTMQYKNWLLQRIKYLKDVERDLHMYTGQFIENNQGVFCTGGTGTCWQGFYKVLKQEAVTGGQSPVGNIYGAGFDFQTLAIVGGGVLLLMLLTKKKTRKR
jgi:hypothetical protein